MKYYVLLTLIPLFTACAAKDDYPSPYSSRPQTLESKHGGGKGLWAPVPFTVTAGDSSAQAYIVSLQAFPVDPKPAAIRPKEVLTSQELAKRETDLTTLRAQKQAISQ